MNTLKYWFCLMLCLTTTIAQAQEVKDGYVRGKIYMKLKDAMTIPFDSTQRNVEYTRTLPFLNKYQTKYQIDQVESPFFFSRSNILKRTFRISFKNDTQVEAFIKDLSSELEVEYAEKVPLDRVTLDPNDLSTDFGCAGLQYYLHDTHAPEAWDITTGSPAVVVAIVDNAVNGSHEDLFGNLVSAWDVSDNDNNTDPPSTTWDHGTHCAGIACAKNNNNKGYASMGYNCGLMAIKASSNSSSSGVDHVYNGYEGIAWASQHGAHVISCSWGATNVSTTYQNVINDAYTLGAVIVAAAGNDNVSTPFYPAAYDHVIAVASLSCSDSKSSFSNYGTWVDICTYGNDIYSSLPSNNYGKKDGTSMATPMVAGLCGLIRTKFPYYNPQEVEIALKQGVYDIYPDNPNYTGQLGAGRIDAYNSVHMPCNGNISLGSSSYSTLKTESSGYILSSNQIAPGEVVRFDASTYINLQPGFTANAGSTFSAYIDGCGGSR